MKKNKQSFSTNRPKIGVTGAAGFVGSNLCIRLSQDLISLELMISQEVIKTIFWI